MDTLAALTLAVWLAVLACARDVRVAVLSSVFLVLYNAIPLLTQELMAPTLEHEVDFAANGCLSAAFAAVSVHLGFRRLAAVFGTYYLFYIYCAFLSANNAHVMPDALYYTVAYALELVLVGVSVGYNTESYCAVDTRDRGDRGGSS